MVWYKNLYVEESIMRKQEKIKRKIRHNAGMIDMYVITVSTSNTGLLDVISTTHLMQKHYPKSDLFVVGLAQGYEKACELACHIIMDIYKKTDAFRIKEYLLGKQYEEKEQVSLCL